MKIGKNAVIAFIIGFGLLLLDLLFCMIALSNMQQIGSTTEWKTLTSVTIIVACGFLGLSVILGIIYFVIRQLEDE